MRKLSFTYIHLCTVYVYDIHTILGLLPIAKNSALDVEHAFSGEIWGGFYQVQVVTICHATKKSKPRTSSKSCHTRPSVTCAYRAKGEWILIKIPLEQHLYPPAPLSSSNLVVYSLLPAQESSWVGETRYHD